MQKIRKLTDAIAGAVDLRDILVFGGFASMIYGIAQVYAPAAWIVGGLGALLIGMRR